MLRDVQCQNLQRGTQNEDEIRRTLYSLAELLVDEFLKQKKENVMTSKKQVQANKKNAKLGGVKTDEGKSVSRQNAIKYGF